MSRTPEAMTAAVNYFWGEPGIKDEEFSRLADAFSAYAAERTAALREQVRVLEDSIAEMERLIHWANKLSDGRDKPARYVDIRVWEDAWGNFHEALSAINDLKRAALAATDPAQKGGSDDRS